MTPAQEISMPKGPGQSEYNKALAECEEAQRRWAALQASIRAGVLDRALVEAVLAMAPRGLYQHFKGGLYVVESAVPDVNGRTDPLVDYTALYGDLSGLPGGRVLYGEDGFLTPVDRPEHLGRRFTRLRNLTIMESAKLRSNAGNIKKAPHFDAAMARIRRTLRP